MKKILLLVIVVIIFAGCATESDPDRLSWDDLKDKAASVFEKGASAMTQANTEAQSQGDDNAWASQNYLKK